MTFTGLTSRIFAIAAMLVALSTGVQAQPINNDYYDPKNASLLKMVEDYHLKQGQNFVGHRQYEQGFNDYMFILRFFPNHPQTLMLMVQLCSEWKSAKCFLDPLFENAIARKPDATHTYVARGIWLQRQKKYSEAIASYQKAIDLDPNSINAHYNLGLAYVVTRQFALANEHAQQAYALGAPLPGLREQLMKAGAWKPLPSAGSVPSGQDASPDSGDVGSQPSTPAVRQ